MRAQTNAPSPPSPGTAARRGLVLVLDVDDAVPEQRERSAGAPPSKRYSGSCASVTTSRSWPLVNHWSFASSATPRAGRARRGASLAPRRACRARPRCRRPRIAEAARVLHDEHALVRHRPRRPSARRTCRPRRCQARARVRARAAPAAAAAPSRRRPQPPAAASRRERRSAPQRTSSVALVALASVHRSCNGGRTRARRSTSTTAGGQDSFMTCSRWCKRKARRARRGRGRRSSAGAARRSRRAADVSEGATPRRAAGAAARARLAERVGAEVERARAVVRERVREQQRARELSELLARPQCAHAAFSRSAARRLGRAVADAVAVTRAGAGCRCAARRRTRRARPRRRAGCARGRASRARARRPRPR